MSAKKVREEISSLEKQIEEKRRYLDRLERNCLPHDWTPAEYTPETTESYTTPGDPPGTMGVDWRGPLYVPATIKDKWTRKCRKCGKTEITSRTDDKITRAPKFPGE